MASSAIQQAQRNRNTIFVEDAEVLAVNEFPGEQFTMRFRAPQCAAAAKPGSFAHITCDTSRPMRRPLSIMRAGDDWIEILFKIVGDGLAQLALKRVGDYVSVMGPIGHPFRLSEERPRPLLIGGGVGIPPMVFIADELRKSSPDWQPLAILGSEIPFPFAAATSTIETPWLDPDISRTMPLLEQWQIPCRLATLAGYDACYRGYVTDLADRWLKSLDDSALSEVEIYACGPTPMLRAVADLADGYGLPCQVSLEEYMACAVGGCAGCVVKIKTDDGPAMKRVCVDGPVFDARIVYWS